MKTIRSVILLLLLCILMPQTLCANSAIRYYQGKSASGTFPLSENPLKVTHESLCFDIDDFPDLYVEFKEDYHAFYTAEYTIENPSDITVSADLAFPIGPLPDYVPENYRDHFGKSSRILVDGKEIPYTLRYSYDPYHSLSYRETLDLLSDQMIEDDFFRADLPVTKLSYQIRGNETDGKTVKNFQFLLQNSDTSEYLMSYYNGLNNTDLGQMEVRIDAERKDSFTFYLLGEAESIPECILLDADDKEIGRLSPETEKTNMKDFLLKDAAGYPDISETDLYNIYLSSLMTQAEHQEPILQMQGLGQDYLANSFLWYTYSLEVPAHTTVVHSVTAPIFPDIDFNYTMPVYQYEYLLSPANGWGSFKDLDIRIQSSRYLLETSFGEATKEEDGTYTLHLEQLPQEELTFKISETLHPQRASNPYFTYFLLLFLPVILLILILLFVIIRKILKKQPKRKR